MLLTAISRRWLALAGAASKGGTIGGVLPDSALTRGRRWLRQPRRSPGRRALASHAAPRCRWPSTSGRAGGRPRVAAGRADRDDAQSIKRHIAVVALAHVPGEDAVALSVVRRLGEGTAARNPAPANVEPIAGEPPARNLGHRSSLALCGAILSTAGRGINGVRAVGSYYTRKKSCRSSAISGRRLGARGPGSHRCGGGPRGCW
jgi:hypothetical protein